MDKSISVIIISYNSEQFIEKCIKSALTYLPQDREIIVLDNASKDQTVKKLKKFLPKIKLIESDINLGFAKGNNKAARSAKGTYLFFLNPDTEIKEPIFEGLLEFYAKTEDAGIVAPKLIMPDGQVQPSVRKFPTILGAINEFIFNKKNSFVEYAPDFKQPEIVDTVYGAAMFIKKDLFWKVGGFDEKYFMYYEDIDLCNKIRKINMKVYYYPEAKIEHLVGGVRSEFDRGNLNYQSFIKYHGLIKSFLLQLIFLYSRLKRRIVG